MTPQQQLYGINAPSHAGSYKPTNIPQRGAVTPTPNFGLPDLTSFTSSLDAINKAQMASYQKTLAESSGPLRDLIFKNSPELASLSQYFQDRLKNPLSPELKADYENQFRDSASGGGWGNYASSPGLPAQEAGYITRIQEQARQTLAPQIQSFGQSILGMTGFGQAPAPLTSANLLNFYSTQQQAALQAGQFQQNFNLQQSQFEAELYASQQQSRFAMTQYVDQQSRIKSFEDELRVQKGLDYKRMEAQYTPFVLPGNPYTAGHISGVYDAQAASRGGSAAPWAYPLR